jgi:hypothetical protein
MHITSVKGKENANSVKPAFMVNLNYRLPMKATKVTEYVKNKMDVFLSESRNFFYERYN